MSTAAIINPCKNRKERELEGTGIICINPQEARKALNKANSLGSRTQFLFNSNLAQVARKSGNHPFFIAGPAVGSPMAVMVLEKLIALGVRELIVYGWCGSLNPELECGDLFLPVWGKSEEGTSAHYPLPYRPESDSQLRKSLRDRFESERKKVFEGPVWTTDAPYRETLDKIETFGQKGIMAVDMEFSALCTVAAFRGVRLGAVFLVSDELFSEKWNPCFDQKAFKNKSSEVLESLMNFCMKRE